MKMTIGFLLLVSTFCVSAMADVYKCEGTDGRTVYSDEPCGRHATRLTNLDVNTLPAIPVAKPHQPPLAPARTAQNLPEAQTPATAPPFVANATECDRARRNADTTASSFTADPTRVELAEREVNIACYGSAKAGEIERARAGATRVIIHNPRPAFRSPRFITHCLGAYCYDGLGGRHPRLGH